MGEVGGGGRGGRRRRGVYESQLYVTKHFWLEFFRLELISVLPTDEQTQRPKHEAERNVDRQPMKTLMAAQPVTVVNHGSDSASLAYLC